MLLPPQKPIDHLHRYSFHPSPDSARAILRRSPHCWYSPPRPLLLRSHLDLPPRFGLPLLRLLPPRLHRDINAGSTAASIPDSFCKKPLDRKRPILRSLTCFALKCQRHQQRNRTSRSKCRRANRAETAIVRFAPAPIALQKESGARRIYLPDSLSTSRSGSSSFESHFLAPPVAKPSLREVAGCRTASPVKNSSQPQSCCKTCHRQTPPVLN